jgi:hypothetical protein
VGFSDFEAPKIVESQALFLGTAEHLPKMVRKNQIDIVIMSLDTSSSSALRPLVIALIRPFIMSQTTHVHGSKDAFPGNLKRTSLAVVKIKNEVISFSALKKLRK